MFNENTTRTCTPREEEFESLLLFFLAFFSFMLLLLQRLEQAKEARRFPDP